MWDAIPPGATLVLLDHAGPGQIDRLKMTLQDRSPAMLRSLRLEIWWDGAAWPGGFYLDSPEDDLPELQPVAERVRGLVPATVP